MKGLVEPQMSPIKQATGTACRMVCMLPTWAAAAGGGAVRELGICVECWSAL
jgi:hypothetical protein